MKKSAVILLLFVLLSATCACSPTPKPPEFMQNYEADFVLDANGRNYTGICSRTDDGSVRFVIRTPEAFAGGVVAFSEGNMSVSYGSLTLSVDALQDFLPADFPFEVAQTLMSLRHSTATVTQRDACFMHEYNTGYGKAVIYQNKDFGSIQRVLCEDARFDISFGNIKEITRGLRE